MPVIDAGYLKDALLQSVEEGVQLGLDEIQNRARKHAPVRDIFKHPHGKTSNPGRVAMVEAMVAKYGAGGPPSMLSARSVNLRNFGMNEGHWLMKAGHSVVSKPGGINVVNRGMVVRGRYNSDTPVIPSPAGLIGSGKFRDWAGPGRLSVGKIHSREGIFDLADLLSSRGRYEAFGRRNERLVGGSNKSGREGRGRAVVSIGGVERVGGRLRESIVTEGPFRRGNEVYGFVLASAHDPGSNHNYAKDQEFGTRHHRAQPFLRPGLRESHQRIVKMIDPSSGKQRGLLQRAFQTGSRPSTSPGDGVGVPVQLKIKAEGWENLSSRWLTDLGLGR